jgi:L-ascorbate metabolism protein UlaG (beta-lactamase superfamily)
LFPSDIAGRSQFYISGLSARTLTYKGMLNPDQLAEFFPDLRDDRPYDLAIMGIGAYDPWIRSHCTPEQAIAMANAAGARFIMPVHHQTFKLSFEPFREPIERFTALLADAPERIALREIGETFVLPA